MIQKQKDAPACLYIIDKYKMISVKKSAFRELVFCEMLAFCIVINRGEKN